jgi:regulatory protein
MAGRRTGGRLPGEQSSAGEPDAGPVTVARNICLRLLTGQPRTRAQLTEALRRREVPERVIESVLDRFTEIGLIDDAAFAATWVQSRHVGRGLARRALSEELRHRGVATETIGTAVAMVDSEAELEMARTLVRRRLPALAGVAAPTRFRRLLGLLARRGYPAPVAAQAVREVMAEPAVADMVDAWTAAAGPDDAPVSCARRTSSWENRLSLAATRASAASSNSIPSVRHQP